MQMTSTQVSDLTNIIQNSGIYKSMKSELLESNAQLRLGRLGGSSSAYLLANLIEDMDDSTLLIVTETQDEIEKIANDLSTFGIEDGVALFQPWQTSLHGGASPAREILADRMLTLERLIHGRRSIVITSIRALMHKIPPIEAFRNATLHFVKGEEIDLTKVSLALIHSGYERVEMVEMKGDFSIRGGILDVYPLSYEMPVRIELFGDEIDSIRYFDPVSQRSTNRVDGDIWIVPMSEIIINPDIIAYWEKRADEIIEKFQSPKLTNEINQLTRSLKEHGRFDGIEGYLPFLYRDLAGLWDYLPKNTIVVMDDPQWLEEEAEKLFEQAGQFYEMETERDRLAVSPSEMFASFDSIVEFCKTRKSLYLTHGSHKNERVHDFGMKTFEGLR